MKLTRRNSFLFFAAFFSGVIGLVFYSSAAIMGTLIVLQCAILIYLLLMGKNEWFVCLLTVFVVMGQEFAYFLDLSNSKTTMYSFKETRILGVNLGLLFLLVFCLKVLVFDNALRNLFSKGLLVSFVKCLSFLVFSAVIIGCLNILLGNNNINNMPNVWHSFFGEASYGIFVVLLSFAYLFTLGKYGYVLLEKTLYYILICNMLAPFLANIFGVVGIYGGRELYLTLSGYMLCSLVIILPGYKEYSNKSVFIYFCFGIGVIYPLFFKSIAFGKLLIIIFMAVFLFLYLKAKRSRMWFLITILIIGLFLFGWNSMITYLIEKNALFSYKYKQIISLISFWKADWYQNILPSPKVRISEIANIFLELIKNPFYLMFGKGTLGTCRDYLNAIPAFDLSIYSYDEFVIGAFYGMHESINIFFLTNGVVGMMFLGYYLKLVLFNIRKNPWIVIGGIWLTLLWGYSITRTMFGVACLSLGLYKITKEKSEGNYGRNK